MAITRLRLTVTPALFATALGVTGLSCSWRVRRPMARLTMSSPTRWPGSLV
jgi:hypothetical protein